MHRSRHTTVTRGAVVLALVIGAALAAPAAALAAEPTVTVMSAQRPLWSEPAVADRFRHVYVFAGQVLRYDTLRDTLTGMGTFIPHSKTASAVFDGARYAYVFGGHEAGGASDKITRYDVRTNTATLMSARLPSVRGFTSAVWTGREAFIFGGGGNCDASGCGQTNQIVRYSPATDSVTVMSATLKPDEGPNAGTIQTSAVWTGRFAYIFGGCCQFTDRIVRYDPESDTVVVMNAALPTPRASTSAVWDGSRAYVFGGTRAFNKDISQNEYYDDIVRYDPETDTVTVLDVALATPREGTAAVWAGAGRVYVFGGFRWTPATPDHSFPLAEIVRFEPRGLGAPPVGRPAAP